MHQATTTAVLTVLSLAAVSAAHGQIDISVNNQAFENRGPSGPAADPTRAIEERYLTGDGDLLLLQEREFFQLRSISDLVYTSNAFLSDDNRTSDTYFREEVALRVSTQVDRTWDLYAEGGVVFTRFFDETDLNTNVPFARVGASTPVGGGVLGGSLTGNFIHDDEFDDNLINQFVVTGFYVKPYELSPDWLLVPRVVWSYTLADPDNFTFFNLSVGTDLIHPLSKNVAWITGVDLYGNFYKDYFSEALDDDRRDYGVRARTELRWTLCPNATLRGIVGLNHQDSTISFLDYDEFNAAASLLLTVEF
jgi:hypothetical protein